MAGFSCGIDAIGLERTEPTVAPRHVQQGTERLLTAFLVGRNQELQQLYRQAIAAIDAKRLCTSTTVALPLTVTGRSRR